MFDKNQEIKINEPINKNYEDDIPMLNINQTMEDISKDPSYFAKIESLKMTEEKKQELREKGTSEQRIKELTSLTDMEIDAYGMFDENVEPTEEEVQKYIDLKVQQRVHKDKPVTDEQREAARQHLRNKRREIFNTNRVNNYLTSKKKTGIIGKLNFEGIENREITRDQKEYGEVYREKEFGIGKSREKAIKNRKSRLYAKDQVAKGFEEVNAAVEEEANKVLALRGTLSKEVKDGMPDDQTITDVAEATFLLSQKASEDELKEKFTRNAESFSGKITANKLRDRIPLLGDISNEIFSIDYSRINLNSPASIVANAGVFERNAKLVDIADRLINQTPGFLNSMVKEKREILLKKIEQGKAIAAYYKVQKMIYTNPYYRTHYNEEISMNALKTDTADKKLLSKLLRTSFYLAKNLDALRIADNPNFGGNDALSNRGALPLPDDKYGESVESEICTISYNEEDYINLRDPKYLEAQKEFEEAQERMKGGQEMKEFISKHSAIDIKHMDRLYFMINDREMLEDASDEDKMYFPEFKKWLKTYKKLTSLIDQKPAGEKYDRKKKTDAELSEEEKKMLEELKEARRKYPKELEEAKAKFKSVKDECLMGTFEERRDALIYDLTKENKKVLENKE